MKVTEVVTPVTMFVKFTEDYYFGEPDKWKHFHIEVEMDTSEVLAAPSTDSFLKICEQVWVETHKPSWFSVDTCAQIAKDLGDRLAVMFMTTVAVAVSVGTDSETGVRIYAEHE